MYCPNCGREYENNQNFCRFCGYKLQEYQPITAESPSLNTQPMENNNQYQNYQQPYQEQNAQVAYQQVENQYQQQVEQQYQQVENQYQQPEYQQEHHEVQPAVEQENQDVQQEEEQEVAQGFDMSKLTNIKLTTKQKILVAIVAILLACFAGLLWSINVETQIIPSETEYNDNFEMNVPSDDDREYTKAPKKQEEATDAKEAEQTEATYAEQPTQETEPPVLEAPIPAPEPVKLAEPGEYSKAPNLYQVPQNEVTAAPANPTEQGQ